MTFAFGDIPSLALSVRGPVMTSRDPGYEEGPFVNLAGNPASRADNSRGRQP
jgi:hypothetical protein